MGLIRQVKSEPVLADQRGTSRDWTSLARQLTSVDVVARRWAARDLADYPEATGALVDQLTREEEPSVRQVILSTLTTFASAPVAAALATCLRSESAALRTGAIEALQEMPDAVVPLMDDLLADPSPDVRIFAVNILESLRHPRVEQWLLNVIEHDQHLNVCATAVDLLGEVGSSAAQGPLVRLKERFVTNAYIQFAADHALRRLADSTP